MEMARLFTFLLLCSSVSQLSAKKFLGALPRNPWSLVETRDVTVKGQGGQEIKVQDVEKLKRELEEVGEPVIGSFRLSSETNEASFSTRT